MAICKLCQEEKQLLNKSQIIPDFLYRHSGMYNQNHKLFSFTLEGLLKKKKPTKSSTGEYEGNILCSNCDGAIIGSYENYAQKLLFGGFTKEPFPACKTYYNDAGDKFTICENVDYRQYKLFLLSLLWKMSISSRPIFKNINFSEELNEELRQMIFNKDPKAFYDFPIYTGYFIKDSTISKDIIVQPVQLEGDGKVILILPGFLYVFEPYSLKDSENLEEIKRNTINEDNTAAFLELENGITFKFIKKVSGL